MTGPERPVFIGFHLTKKENQDCKSGPNRFGSVWFCGFNRSLGPDFQALVSTSGLRKRYSPKGCRSRGRRQIWRKRVSAHLQCWFQFHRRTLLLKMLLKKLQNVLKGTEKSQIMFTDWGMEKEQQAHEGMCHRQGYKVDWGLRNWWKKRIEGKNGKGLVWKSLQWHQWQRALKGLCRHLMKWKGGLIGPNGRWRLPRN